MSVKKYFDGTIILDNDKLRTYLADLMRKK
jgi:hypothetical protein